MISYYITLISIIISSACSVIDQVNNANTFNPAYDMTQLPVSDLYEPAISLGVITDSELHEISGMVPAYQTDTLFWVHNDSGNSNHLFLLNANGTQAASYKVNGAENRDWEDIAIGIDPETNQRFIYIAEIGDNNARYEYKHIYRVAEPVFDPQETKGKADAEKFTIIYENNRRMDAETLLVDPWTNNLYIVTKREFPIVVYEIKFPLSPNDTIIARKAGTLPFTSATAGDISPDGKNILIKNYEDIFMWTRQEGEPIDSAFVRPPVRLNYTPEQQGEAITFSPDGNGFFTTSERRNDIDPQVMFYRKSE